MADSAYDSAPVAPYQQDVTKRAVTAPAATPAPAPPRPASGASGYDTAPVRAATPAGAGGGYDTATAVQGQAPPDQTDRGEDIGGYEGGAFRALAPIATTTAVGAGIGSVVPGVGTGVGAAFGLGAGVATDIVSGLYNAVANETGWPKMATLPEMTDKLSDYFGIERPHTTGQRLFEAGVGAAASAGGGAKAAEMMAPVVASKVTKGVLEEVARKPVAQTAAATAGGVAGQGAREAGLPDWASQVVGLGTTLLAPTVGRGLMPGRPIDPAITARDNGYVIHPGEMSREPGAPAQTAAGSAGKQRLQQEASIRNQEVTNGLAAQDIGLPANTPLTPDTLAAVRDRAYQAYRDIKQAVPIIFTRAQRGPLQQQVISPISPRQPMPLEPEFETAVRDISEIGEDARLRFPSLHINEIEDLKTELRGEKPGRGALKSAMTPEEALDYIKAKRFEAKENFLAKGDPSRAWLASAQLRAADAVEELLERQLVRSGPQYQGLVDAYRAARQLAAKTYNIEIALDGNDVNASKIASLSRVNRSGSRRAYLTGNLQTIADTYNQFPRNLALPRGPTEALTALDFMGGLGTAAVTGHLALGAWPLLRPLARHTLLSEPFQNYQVRGGQFLQDLRGPVFNPPGPGRTPRALPLAVVGAQGGEASNENSSLNPDYYDDAYQMLSGGWQ